MDKVQTKSCNDLAMQQNQEGKKILYYLLIDFLQQEEFPQNLIQEAQQYIEKQIKLDTLIQVNGKKDSASFQEMQMQFLVRQNSQIKSLLPMLTQFIKNNKQDIGRDQQAYIDYMQEKFLKFCNLLEKPPQITRRDMIKKKQRNWSDEQYPLEIFRMFQRQKSIFGHGFPIQSNQVYQENDEPYIPIYNLFFDQSGKLIITGDDEGLIKIWSAENGLLLSNLKGHTTIINLTDISPCNKYLASCSQDGTVRVWDFFQCRPVAVFREMDNEPMSAVLFYSHKDENNKSQLFLITGSEKGNIYIYKEEDFCHNNGVLNQQQKVIKLQYRSKPQFIQGKFVESQNNDIMSLEYHPQGYLTVGTEQGEVLVWDKIYKLEARNKNPPIVLAEHKSRCAQIKWNKDGTKMITASFDGTAKIYDWDLRGVEHNKGLKSFQTLQYDTHKTSQCICWAVCWSCQSNYALISFCKNVKKRLEGQRFESAIYVYNSQNRQVQGTIDRESTPLKFEYQIMILEAHPFRENIAFSADYNGQIVLWDFVNGIILNIFQERGTSIKYPNLECPILDGKFSPDGLSLAVSTYFGTFSIYGYGNSDFYKISPNEQFFSNDNEPFVLDDDLRVIPIDVIDIDMHEMERGRICSNSRVPYLFQYFNNLNQLQKIGFFDEKIKLLNYYKQKENSILQYSGQNRNYKQEEIRYIDTIQKQIYEYKTVESILQNHYKNEMIEKGKIFLQMSNILRTKFKYSLEAKNIYNYSIQQQKISSEEIQLYQKSHSLKQLQTYNNNDDNNSNTFIQAASNNQNQNQFISRTPSANQPRRQENRRLRRIGQPHYNQANHQNNMEEDEKLQDNQINQDNLSPFEKQQQEAYKNFCEYDDPGDENWEDPNLAEEFNNYYMIKSNGNRRITRNQRKASTEKYQELDDELSFRKMRPEDDNNGSEVEEFGENGYNIARRTRTRGKRLKHYDNEDDSKMEDDNEESEKMYYYNKKKHGNKLELEQDDPNDNSIQFQQKPNQHRLNNNNAFSNSRMRDDSDDDNNQTLLKKRSNPYSQQNYSNQMNSNGLNNSSMIGESIYSTRSRTNKNKKLKIDYDDDEDQYFNSNAMKTEKCEVNAICDRCNAGEAKKRCFSCSKAFHDACFRYCGVQKDNKNQCYLCNIKQSFSRRDETDKGKVNRYYLQQLEQGIPYVPQLGDQVYFFFQGYEEFLANYFEIINFNFLLTQEIFDEDDTSIPLPFKKHHRLYEPTLCTITNISFHFPIISSKKQSEKFLDKQIFMLLTLKINADVSDSEDLFMVYFANNALIPSYLVLQDVYEKSKNLEKTLDDYSLVSVYYNNQIFEVQIIQNSPYEELFPDSPWMRYSVRSLDDDSYKLRKSSFRRVEDQGVQNKKNYPERVSSWQIIKEGGIINNPVSFCSQEDANDMIQYIELLKNERQKECNLFIDPVNTKQYKDYLDFVPVPIDLSMIQMRIRNGYYRTKDSIKHDINLLKDNAFLYNDKSSYVCEYAKTIQELLLVIIEHYKQKEEVLPRLFSSKKAYKTFQDKEQYQNNANLRKTRSSIRQDTQQQENSNQLYFNNNLEDQQSFSEANLKQSQKIQSNNQIVKDHSQNDSDYSSENCYEPQQKKNQQRNNGTTIKLVCNNNNTEKRQLRSRAQVLYVEDNNDSNYSLDKKRKR